MKNSETIGKISKYIITICTKYTMNFDLIDKKNFLSYKLNYLYIETMAVFNTSCIGVFSVFGYDSIISNNVFVCAKINHVILSKTM